jgi:hypothetical protein
MLDTGLTRYSVDFLKEEEQHAALAPALRERLLFPVTSILIVQFSCNRLILKLLCHFSAMEYGVFNKAIVRFQPVTPNT